MAAVKFGLTLPNRMVVIGVGTIQDIISMGVDAEETGLFQSIWVGDSILAKRRPESVALLAALAARTQHVRLGVGCMASFPIRNPFVLAAQWATLDLIAGPDRLILAACQGGAGGGGDWEMEQDAFGVPTGQRVRRMIENVEALRALWTQESASYEGQYVNFSNVISEPRPVTKPHPALWIAANPRPVNGDTSVIQKATRRVARLADGWMPTRASAEDIKRGRATLNELAQKAGRDPGSVEVLAFGTAGQFRDREVIRDMEESGVNRVTIWLTHTEGAESLAELEEIATQVL